MNWWFFSIICIGILGVIINVINHGKKRPDYNAYVSFIAFIIEIIMIYFAIRSGI